MGGSERHLSREAAGIQFFSFKLLFFFFGSSYTRLTKRGKGRDGLGKLAVVERVSHSSCVSIEMVVR